MANELRHADVGTALSKTEWEATAGHIFNNQAAGDIMYASSTSQLSRLAIGAAKQFLVTNDAGTAPAWTSSPAVVTAITPDASDGATLGTAALEWSDLYLADAAVIYFGDDDDVTLTHVHNDGLLLSGTDQLQFGDSGTYIYQSTDGQLDLVADTEIQIAATTIDINGALALNGAITGATNITLSGELDAATLDLSGNADVDGTMEADAYTVDGATLAEYIADTVGAMVSSNTESGIAVAYQDADNTLDFTVGTLNQDTTGTAAIATAVTITDNESTDEDNAVIFTAGGDVDGGNLGLESDGNLTYNPSTGRLTATQLAGTLQTASQTAITAVGTLSGLTTSGAIELGHASDTTLARSAGGTVTIEGDVITTAGTMDMWVPAGAMRPASTNGCAAITDVETTATRPDMQVLDFHPSTQEYAQFSIAMPKSWNEGTVTAQFYWTHATAVATDVIWGIQGVCVKDNDTIDIAYGTAQTVTDTFHNTAEDLAISAATSAITLAGNSTGSPQAGDLAFFQVYRDADAAGDDTNSTDARLAGVKLIFTTDAANDA